MAIRTNPLRLESCAKNVAANGFHGVAAELRYAASTIESLSVKVRELEQKLQWAQYTEPPDRWLATKIELESQNQDDLYAEAEARDDGDPGFVVTIREYFSDDPGRRGRGGTLREAFECALNPETEELSGGD